MMKSKSNIFVLALLLVGSILVLYWSYQSGEEKSIFTVAPLPEPLLVPILHDHYSGTAVWVEPNRIKVKWAPFPAAALGDSLYLEYLGDFNAATTGCCLLRIGRQLIVERRIFIKPLATINAYFQQHGTLPEEITEIVSNPELERDMLEEFFEKLAPPAESVEPEPTP